MYFRALCSASLRAIYHSSLDCPVRKLPYCPQRHVLFVNNYMLVCTKWREVRKLLVRNTGSFPIFESIKKMSIKSIKVHVLWTKFGTCLFFLQISWQHKSLFVVGMKHISLRQVKTTLIA